MGAYSSFVAGLQHRPKSILKALTGLAENEPLDLVREPENPHDENAIALYWKGHHVGYVPARHAEWLAGRMDRDDFAEVYVVDFESSGWLGRAVTSIDTLIVTSIWDAPEGSSTAQRADLLAAEQQAVAEERARMDGIVSRLGPVATEIVALLRWIGRVADGPSEEKERLIDGCLTELLGTEAVTVSEGLIARLRRPAASLKGSEKRAIQAIERIVADRTHVPHVSKAVLALVQLDGTVTADEEKIVRRFLDLARSAAHSTR